MNGILGRLGIDPFYLFIIVFVLQIAIIILLVIVDDKYRHVLKSYNVFMRGKNGKNLEESIFSKFSEIDEAVEIVKENERHLKEMTEKMATHYQKVGIVKYDAFHEMGGELSFALTMLDENNNGWIMNAMHSREGCYTYIKEIVKGESYIELSEEEKQCLDKVIYPDEYDSADTKQN